MLLTHLFSPKKTIVEGGNVSSQSPGWQGMPGDHKAEEIDLKIHNRDFMVEKMRELLKAQNESFAATYGRPIWDPALLDANEMFSGSSLQFFDVKGISTQDFMNKLKKTKVGDIDTQVDQEIGEQITEWLTSIIGKPIGNGTFVGFNSSLSALWLLQDPPVKVQVDYELGPYEPAKGKEPARPTEWFAYSHSSDMADMEQGIKGVFHKWINRALTHAQASTKYVARVLKKSVKISPEPVTDADYSFAVTSSQGGGLASKYKPYIDPATGQPMEIDGIPVMQLLDTAQRDYIQNLDLQFQTMYGRKRTAKDKKLQNSFVGTLELMNSNFSVEQNDAVAEAFIQICFGTGAQMITAGNPERDRDTKLAAIDYMVENLMLTDAATLRQQAVDLAVQYETNWRSKKGGVVENFADGRNPQDKGDAKRHGINTKASVSSLRKTAKQGGRKGQLAHWLANMKAGRAKAKKESISEAEVQAQLRKNMPHLRALKPLDLIDLLDEIHDGNGSFKLQNIPLNVKVDGFGGRFGKNAEGKPFMGTSNTPPRYEANFMAYHQAKGTTDPDILNRSQLFDNLFNEMMNAVAIVDQSLGEDFLVDKQVTCEVLYLPFATETPDGKLKFVGIHYDKLPEGVQLALVPYRVVEASTGQDVPDTDRIVKALTNLGQQGSVMFISNKLTQKEALDVTGIVPPMENLETFKQIMNSSGKGTMDLKRQVKAALEPVALALEKAIIEDPNIVGKDMLGQNYEGIVLNTRLGPVKVTSAEQRKVIADKQAAAKAARVEQPKTGNKTAVVAIGSFVGHIGHEQLWDYTVSKASEVGGDPYLFMGNAVGKDDPIPVETKLATWHKLYPEYANNISATMAGGSLMQKIKHELINPLPGKPPRYDNIIIMVGEDQAGMNIANALMKAVNKFQGYEHVKVSLEPTPRGTGMSFSKLRNILKDNNATPQDQLDLWTQAFDVNKLGVDYIKQLMDITRKGMGIQMPQQQPQPVPERLLNALIMPQLNENTSKYKVKVIGQDKKGEYYVSPSTGQKVYKKARVGDHEVPDTKEIKPKVEEARQSAAVKLQKAFHREQEKGEASRKRGEEVMAKAKKDSEKEKQGVAEGNETTPFGSVNDQRPQMPDVPQQDREAQEQARERQARINDFREKKQDLLQQFAQLGTLRTEMIYGLENNVFLSKEQLIDFFKQQIDDPSLTALEYAYDNDIPTGGLMKHILRRAAELGISMLDVRKMFSQAKQKLGENIGRKVDAKGRTQSEWMQLVKQHFPDARIIQSKMIDGPAQALLSDGRKIVWNPVQGMAEAKKANTKTARAEFSKRPRAELSDKEKAKEKADSDAAWERLMSYAAAQKKEGVKEGSNERKQNALWAQITAHEKAAKQSKDLKRQHHLKMADQLRSQLKTNDNEQGVAEGSLNEFAPGGNSASSYYAVTANFVNEFSQQKQEELQDLIDAGWTKQDLAQAGTLKGQAADIAHFEQVRDGFLKGLKPGFDAYLQGDTQLKDQLGAYWMENDLPLNQDWEKIYGEPWGDDSEFNEDLNEFASGDGDDNDLLYYAKMFHKALVNNDFDTQDQITQALEPSGWEIGPIESEEGGVFVVQADGSNYIGFAPNDLAEDTAKGSNSSMSYTAKRLTNPNDGKVAKLRAAGDKRREDHLKSRDIAKKNEAMLPKSAFAGSDKNKLGTAGQWRNKGPKANKPAKAGDLVGGAAESYNKIVPVREDVENIIGSLVEQLSRK